jgi:hypothetical protein
VSARLVTTYASTSNLTTHNIPLTGKTNGRDMFALVTASALLTPSSPWVVNHSELLGGSNFTSALFTLAGASNGSSYSGPFSVTLNGPVALSAIVWEDDLDTATAIYCDFIDSAVLNTSGIPTLQGTGLHTFTTKSVGFAFFGANETDPTYDLVSYDHSYVEFADTGLSASTEQWRQWLATASSTSMTNDGVTATGNNTAFNSGIFHNGVGGFIAYNQVVATPAAPSNTVAPAVTGTVVTGQTLTCSTGTWTGYPTPTYTYQWKRNGVNITGATSSTYVLVTADEGTAVKCTVTATNASGNASADSNTVNPTSGAGGTAPSNTAAPFLAGTALVGVTLTCSAGTWTGTPTPTYAYSWKRDGTALGVFTNTYTLVSGDAGHAIKCSVTASNTAGASTADSNTVTPSSPTPGATKAATVHRLRAGAWETLDLSGGGSGGSGVDVAGFAHRAQPEDFGAKGDCKTILDATMSGGTSTLTSAAGGFVSTDAGKKIMVRGAGPTSRGGCLVADINTVNSATNVTLSASATGGIANGVATYGTDDTNAFKSALNQIVTDAINDLSYAAQLVLSAKEYMIAGAPVVGGSTAGNAQIPLPMIPTSGKKFVLSIQGPVDGSGFYHWKQIPPASSGAVIRSAMVGVTQDATWLAPSCIGGPTVLPTDGGTAPFSNMLIHLDGFKIMAPRDPCFVGIDLHLVAQANIGTLACVVDASPNKSGLEGINASVSNQQGMGLRMPGFQNNDNTNIFSFGCEGFYYGIAIADHLTAQRLALIYCNTAIYTDPTGGPEHGTFIGYISCEACVTGLMCNGAAGSKYPTTIERFDVEVSGGGFTIDDANSALTGVIHYAHNASAAPTLNGGTNIKVIDDNRYPGYVSSGAPAVPASTTALRNPFFRDAAVFISGGTVSQVTVDGQATFTASNCMVIVPNNKQIAITYSSAPTWKWFLL